MLFKIKFIHRMREANGLTLHQIDVQHSRDAGSTTHHLDAEPHYCCFCCALFMQHLELQILEAEMRWRTLLPGRKPYDT